MQPRPSRRRLRQSGPFRDRVFGCDLSEHVLLSGRSGKSGATRPRPRRRSSRFSYLCY